MLGRLVDQGFIPSNEIWIKNGGDKGGQTMKFSFQICNNLHPNSFTNTCVFVAFEAVDTRCNLHVSVDRYKSQIQNLKRFTWQWEIVLNCYSVSFKFIFKRNSKAKTSLSSSFCQEITSFFAICMAWADQVILYIYLHTRSVVEYFPNTSGRHRCLFCLMPSDDLKIPRHQHGRYTLRSLQRIQQDHQAFWRQPETGKGSSTM